MKYAKPLTPQAHERYERCQTTDAPAHERYEICQTTDAPAHERYEICQTTDAPAHERNFFSNYMYTQQTIHDPRGPKNKLHNNVESGDIFSWYYNKNYF